MTCSTISIKPSNEGLNENSVFILQHNSETEAQLKLCKSLHVCPVTVELHDLVRYRNKKHRHYSDICVLSIDKNNSTRSTELLRV